MTSELIRTATVTIADGQSLSGSSGDIGDKGKLVAVITGANWATQAMTFQVSVDGETFFNLYDEGTEYSMVGVVASAYNRVDLNLFAGANYLKVRSGTAGTPAAQAGGDDITLVFWQVE